MNDLVSVFPFSEFSFGTTESCGRELNGTAYFNARHTSENTQNVKHHHSSEAMTHALSPAYNSWVH